MPMADAGQKLQQNREVYAFAGPRPAQVRPLPPAALGEERGTLPAYRPTQLPAAPRNPIAEREEEALRAAPPRTPFKPAQPVGEPVLLYGKGKGPFLPLQEHEIDPQDLDEYTGSVGE